MPRLVYIVLNKHANFCDTILMTTLNAKAEHVQRLRPVIAEPFFGERDFKLLQSKFMIRIKYLIKYFISKLTSILNIYVC